MRISVVSPHVKGERPDLEISTEPFCIQRGPCIPYSDGPNVTDDPRLGLLCLQVAKIKGVKKSLYVASTQIGKG